MVYIDMNDVHRHLVFVGLAVTGVCVCCTEWDTWLPQRRACPNERKRRVLASSYPPALFSFLSKRPASRYFVVMEGYFVSSSSWRDISSSWRDMCCRPGGTRRACDQRDLLRYTRISLDPVEDIDAHE